MPLTTTSPRVNYLYIADCTDCNRPARRSQGVDKGRTTTINCPDCRKLLTGTRVATMAMEGSGECTTGCRESNDLHCVCPCGGFMHGLYWGTASTLGLVTAEMLAEYRGKELSEEATARAVAREKETAAKKAAYFDWVSIGDHAHIAGTLMAEKDPTRYLKLMKDRVMTYQPLLEVTVVYLREVFARREAVAAVRAARYPMNAGKQEITGRIMCIRITPSHLGGGFLYSMTVLTDHGNLVRCRLPCVIKDWALGRDNFSGKTAALTVSPEEYWTSFLRDMPVTMKTTIRPWPHDNTVGLGTYPTMVEFPADWKQAVHA